MSPTLRQDQITNFEKNTLKHTVGSGDDMRSYILEESHVKDEANYNPNDESELAITGPTLIKVESSKVVDYIEGEEEIKGYLE